MWLYTLYNIFKCLTFERCQGFTFLYGSLLNSIHPLYLRSLLHTHKICLGTYILLGYIHFAWVHTFSWVHTFYLGTYILLGYIHFVWVNTFCLGTNILLGYIYFTWVHIFCLGKYILLGYIHFAWAQYIRSSFMYVVLDYARFYTPLWQFWILPDLELA